MIKTNDGLVDWCISIINQNGKYLYGGYFDRIATAKYIDEKAGQYPKQYTAVYTAKTKAHAIGFIAGDCIGLIKAYVWLDGLMIIYPKDKATRALQDKSADGMFLAAKVKGPISTLPETPGICVRFKDHVGVYIGGGRVIEARGVSYGVTFTILKDRPWTDWYECHLIDYLKEGDEPMLKRTTPTTKGDAVRLYQTLLRDLGYNLGKFGIDESYGDDMVTATKQAQKDYGLTQTGEVDALLFGKLAKTRIIKLNDSYDALNKLYNKTLNESLQKDLILKAHRESIVLLTNSSKNYLDLKSALTTIYDIIK